jgi:hypothetical protein
MYQRIVFASAQAISFEDAAESLMELADLKLLPKRVWRAAKRVGEERVEECRADAEEYLRLPLPARRQSPQGQPVPMVACVQMDGGRFQERERKAGKPAGSEASAKEQETSCWREYKAGVLLSMTSETHGRPQHERGLVPVSPVGTVALEWQSGSAA